VISMLRQRNFALLWWGGLISMIGDWMLRIALPAFVFQMTGSTLATGAMFIAGQLPQLLLGSVAGVFVDRWDRKRTMVIANLLMMVGVLPLGLVQSAEWLWVVYVVSFWQSCIGQFFGPAENALLPTLVAEEKLVTANSLNALNNNLARLIGPALGGVLAVSLGLYGVALLDALTFAIAAGMIALITTPERSVAEPTATEKATTTGWSSVWHEWRAGLALVAQTPILRVLFTIIALWALGEGIMSVLFVPFVTEIMKGQALEVGWLMSAQAIGGLTGGVVMAKIGERISPAILLGPCSILFGLIDLMIFNYSLFFSGFMIGVVLFMVVGIPGAGSFASLLTLLQTSVSDDYRGRLFGAFTTTFGLVALLGMGIATAFGDVIGILTLINVQGIALVLGGLVAVFGLRGKQDAENEKQDAESGEQKRFTA
jgi:MFS family permease